MKKTSIIVTLVLFSCLPSASAARLAVHDAADSQEYKRKFGGMIGRGLLNVSTSFVDLFVNTANETKNGPPLVGTLVGIGKGAGCTVLRALSGGLDLVTFWVPGFNGMPVSESYDNCLNTPAGGQPYSTSPTPAGYPSGESTWEEPATSTSGAAPKKEDKPRFSK